MITFIEKIIRDKWPDAAGESDMPLAYLKLCTPTSGGTLNDKVIFLVFKNNSRLPFLCVKTVRNYGAKEVILRNFRNLKMLNGLTANSDFAKMFAGALYVHDDGEHIFSVEQACSGAKIVQNEKNLKRVVGEYGALQEHFFRRGSEIVGEPKVFAGKIIANASFPPADRSWLLDYTGKSFPNSIRLPRIMQHGDLTFDNLLLSPDGLRIIDYDFVGVTDLPGFDLFGLCRRFYRIRAPQMCRECLSEFFKKIDVEANDEDYRGLFFLYHLVEYLKRKPDLSGNVSAKKMVFDFESSYASL